MSKHCIINNSGEDYVDISACENLKHNCQDATNEDYEIWFNDPNDTPCFCCSKEHKPLQVEVIDGWNHPVANCENPEKEKFYQIEQ